MTFFLKQKLVCAVTDGLRNSWSEITWQPNVWVSLCVPSKPSTPETLRRQFEYLNGIHWKFELVSAIISIFTRWSRCDMFRWMSQQHKRATHNLHLAFRDLAPFTAFDSLHKPLTWGLGRLYSFFECFFPELSDWREKMAAVSQDAVALSPLWRSRRERFPTNSRRVCSGNSGMNWFFVAIFHWNLFSN